jgi:hypothetical protein
MNLLVKCSIFVLYQLLRIRDFFPNLLRLRGLHVITMLGHICKFLKKREYLAQFSACIVQYPYIPV